MPDEIVTLVDASDCVIGEALRSRVREQGLIHRVCYILVFNAEDELLLQKRTQTKDLYPGCYDAAAGGVLLVDESYELSARRELQEELGVSAALKTHFDHYFDDGFNRYWGRVFSCQHEGPFKLQAAEVESAQFVEVQTIMRGDFSPLTPDTLEVLHKWLEY